MLSLSYFFFCVWGGQYWSLNSGTHDWTTAPVFSAVSLLSIQCLELLLRQTSCNKPPTMHLSSWDHYPAPVLSCQAYMTYILKYWFLLKHINVTTNFISIQNTFLYNFLHSLLNLLAFLKTLTKQILRSHSLLHFTPLLYGIWMYSVQNTKFIEIS
jgi:hypothetical protein